MSAITCRLAIPPGVERVRARTAWRRPVMEQARRFVRLSEALTLAVMLLLARPTFAQVDTGAILGTVKDQSGAVVPGAKVTLTNEGTSFSVSTTAGSDGGYTFTPVRLGMYTVEAGFPGLQTASHPPVNADVRQHAGPASR